MEGFDYKNDIYDVKLSNQEIIDIGIAILAASGYWEDVIREHGKLHNGEPNIEFTKQFQSRIDKSKKLYDTLLNRRIRIEV